MGCDIHPHFEVKIAGIWRYYSPVDIRRNYIIFAKMAGVRTWVDGPTAISQPKGLPKDVSFMVKYQSNIWGSDGHSHSWLDYEELMELMKFIGDEEIKEPWGGFKGTEFGVYLFGNSIESFKEYPKDYPEDLEDIRIVFWFDN